MESLRVKDRDSFSTAVVVAVARFLLCVAVHCGVCAPREGLEEFFL